MSNTPDISTALSQILQQSGGALSSPFQPTPASKGSIDPSAHPMLAKVIQALASGAGAYGWTAMPPQEREARTQMEQQKAETMARLAQTGAYQQGELEYRKNLADVAGRREQDYAADVQRKKEQGETSLQIKQQMADLAQEKNQWMKEMASGRLDAAKTRISNQARQFEQTFQLRAKQVGIEQAKLELAEQGMGIKQGFLDLAKTALSQKGTAEGLNTITKLQSIAYEHPILSQAFGLDDVTQAVQESRGAGIPGVGAGPVTGQPGPTAPLPAPPAPNKAEAKRRQKTPQPSGATHMWTPNGIQPIGGQPQ